MAAHRDDGIAFPLKAYAAVTAVLLVLQHLANDILPPGTYRWDHLMGLRWYLDGWNQFDGPEY